MSTTVSTSKELGVAIKASESTIIIEGKLGNAVIAIQAIGPVAWGTVIAATAVAITGTIVSLGTVGAGAPVDAVSKLVATPALITAVGGSTSTATTLMGIAIAGGGVGVLTSLRKYNATKKGNKVILTKK